MTTIIVACFDYLSWVEYCT